MVIFFSFRIMIVCPQCEAPTVNSNERIAFQMAYKDYGTMGYLDFEWEVELVEGPVPSDIYAHDNPCVSPDGSSYKSYRFFSNETAENETTTTEVQDIKTISSVTSSPPTQISTGMYTVKTCSKLNTKLMKTSQTVGYRVMRE